MGATPLESKPAARSRASFVARCLVLSGLVLLTACPGDPEPSMDVEPYPSPTPTTAQGGPSVIDSVDVVSPLEAEDQAQSNIDGDNVLDELQALEAEMGEP